MSSVTNPIALNESFISTESTPRNIADVLADELENIASAIEEEGGGGHTIQNSQGVDLPQESKLQFGGMLKATDDSTNGVTKVSDLAEEVDWSVWNAMTEAQRTAYSVGKKLDIVNVPSVSGSIPVELMKTLWTNPNPSASFAEQTITLSSDDYDFLLIVGSFVSSAPNDRISVIVPKGSGAYLSMADTNASGANNAYRCFNYTNTTTYSVLNAYSGTSSNVNNNRCVPTAIYGIKSSVNVDMSALVANVSTSADKCMLSDGETSVEDAIESSASKTDVSALETKVTPQIIFPLGSVSFTNGNAWIANSDFHFAHFMPMTAQCVGANAPCVVSIDAAGAGVFVTLPINTTFTGSLDVIIYGIGWN